MAEKKKEENPLLVEVTTPNGVVKQVTGTDADKVSAGAEAVKNEPKLVEVDIDNPKHGNMTYAELQATAKKK
jgi:hypothetical protein